MDTRTKIATSILIAIISYTIMYKGDMIMAFYSVIVFINILWIAKSLLRIINRNKKEDE